MGLFDKILGNTSKGSTQKPSLVSWVSLENMEQLDELVLISKDTPVAIFKHSTRCGISRMVLNSFEKEFDLNEDQIKMYFLDLIQFRAISNEIAERFKVWHESPQLLLIQNGETTHHSSHSNIAAQKLRDFIV